MDREHTTKGFTCFLDVVINIKYFIFFTIYLTIYIYYIMTISLLHLQHTLLFLFFFLIFIKITYIKLLVGFIIVNTFLYNLYHLNIFDFSPSTIIPPVFH